MHNNIRDVWNIRSRTIFDLTTFFVWTSIKHPIAFMSSIPRRDIRQRSVRLTKRQQSCDTNFAYVGCICIWVPHIWWLKTRVPNSQALNMRQIPICYIRLYPVRKESGRAVSVPFHSDAALRIQPASSDAAHGSPILSISSITISSCYRIAWPSRPWGRNFSSHGPWYTSALSCMLYT